MNDTGFISLHRSLIGWEWYDDVNTTRVFIHLLLTVNWEDGNWHGIKIERGSRISSYSKLAKETHLSVQEVRTALKKLKSTGELTIKTTSQYTFINVVNYTKFQDVNFTINKPSNKRATKEQQQYNKNNKNNNIYIYKTDKNKNFDNYSKKKEFTQEEENNMKDLMNKYREE